MKTYIEHTSIQYSGSFFLKSPEIFQTKLCSTYLGKFRQYPDIFVAYFNAIFIKIFRKSKGLIDTGQLYIFSALEPKLEYIRIGMIFPCSGMIHKKYQPII